MSRKKYVGLIELTKYKDMAYCNKVGRIWLRTLSCANIWSLWEEQLRAFSRSLGTNVSAERVKVMCIWNFGFLERNNGGGVRTAFEIRNPRGSKEDLAARQGARETRCTIAKLAIGGPLGGKTAMSREMQMFDEFLERVVRPLVDAQLSS